MISFVLTHISLELKKKLKRKFKILNLKKNLQKAYFKNFQNNLKFKKNLN